MDGLKLSPPVPMSRDPRHGHGSLSHGRLQDYLGSYRLFETPPMREKSFSVKGNNIIIE
jgi:hypothetical protein